MELNEYQDKAMATCMPSCDNFSYMFIGFVGELGEFASKVAKAIRKNKTTIDFDNLNCYAVPSVDIEYEKELQKGLKAELGDCAWFLAGLCEQLGWTLEEVCQENLDKLASRKERNVIDGSGDNR